MPNTIGPGPSPANLFDIVLNLPGDEAVITGAANESIGGVPGQTTQLNVDDGGTIGFNFQIEAGGEVNVSGGTVGSSLDANSGSELNISGGTVGEFLRANTNSRVNFSGGTIIGGLRVFSGGVFNMSGGDVVPAPFGIVTSLRADPGGVINISGGNVGDDFQALSESVVNISGGNIGDGFQAFMNSTVNISGGTFGRFDTATGNIQLIGGEFRLNGAEFPNGTIMPNNGDILTCTLADGSPFAFRSDDLFFFSPVTLTTVALPAVDLSPIVINTPVVTGFSGLRSGQMLTLEAGGALRDNFTMVDATFNVEDGFLDVQALALDSVVNISGGTVGGSSTFDSSFTAYNSVVNISGGTVGSRFEAEFGSVVNISGGTVGSVFDAEFGSVVNISGGNVGVGFDAESGCEVNISGGSVGSNFDAESGSVVNISGGTVGSSFDAELGCEVNIFGSQFFIDGAPLNILVPGQPVTITDRDVTLTGLLADGEPFSFDLNQVDDSSSSDFFDPGATLTVTIGAPAPDTILGDVDQDGDVDFSDIPAFIAVLQAGTFLEEADCNLDGEVNFADIPVFIAILIAN